MVAAVIVSFGQLLDAQGLIDDYLHQAGCVVENVVLVDNYGEDEEELRALSELSDRVSVLRPGRNLGYLGGVRFALSAQPLAGNELSWLIVSNPDVRLTPGFVAGIVATDGDVIAPTVITNGCDVNPYMLERPRRHRFFGARVAATGRWILSLATIVGITRRLIPAKTRRGALTLPTPAYAPHGSIFALRSTYLSRPGSVSYPMFLFGEELWIGEQSLRYGLQVLYQPSAVAFHIGRTSTGILRSSIVTKYLRDSLRFNLTYMFGTTNKADRQR